MIDVRTDREVVTRLNCRGVVESVSPAVNNKGFRSVFVQSFTSE